MKVICENDIVKVSETGTIGGNDWCGILADGMGYMIADELLNGRFLAETTH